MGDLKAPKRSIDSTTRFDPPVAWPWPTGTNLLDATQVTVMAQHMVAGLPANEVPEPNSEWEAKPPLIMRNWLPKQVSTHSIY